MNINNINSNLLDDLLKLAQSSLDNFTDEITVKQSEISQASTSYQYIKRVLKIKSEEGKIPELNSGIEPFLIGSYARKTKISPLNDIDTFIVLDGTDTRVDGNYLYYTSLEAPLSDYSTDGATISSIKVLNAVKSALDETYESEIVRDQQAVSVYLDSYDMTIDIVPSVKIRNSEEYIIPFGGGFSSWKMSNPKKDEQILASINSYHNETVKPAIKIVKYWNRERNFSKLRNYHLEAMAYFIFGMSRYKIPTVYLACKKFFDEMSNYLVVCPDPTGLSEPIRSSLDLFERMNQNTRITKAKEAISKDSSSFIAYLRGN